MAMGAKTNRSLWHRAAITPAPILDTTKNLGGLIPVSGRLIIRRIINMNEETENEPIIAALADLRALVVSHLLLSVAAPRSTGPGPRAVIVETLANVYAQLAPIYENDLRQACGLEPLNEPRVRRFPTAVEADALTKANDSVLWPRDFGEVSH